MADVQCGKFEYMGSDPQTGEVKFRGRLTPAPTPQWVAVFNEYQAVERGLGNTAVASISGRPVRIRVLVPVFMAAPFQLRWRSLG